MMKPRPQMASMISIQNQVISNMTITVIFSLYQKIEKVKQIDNLRALYLKYAISDTYRH